MSDTLLEYVGNFFGTQLLNVFFLRNSWASSKKNGGIFIWYSPEELFQTQANSNVSTCFAYLLYYAMGPNIFIKWHSTFFPFQIVKYFKWIEL